LGYHWPGATTFCAFSVLMRCFAYRHNDSVIHHLYVDSERTEERDMVNEKIGKGKEEHRGREELSYIPSAKSKPLTALIRVMGISLIYCIRRT